MVVPDDNNECPTMSMEQKKQVWGSYYTNYDEDPVFLGGYWARKPGYCMALVCARGFVSNDTAMSYLMQYCNSNYEWETAQVQMPFVCEGEEETPGNDGIDNNNCPTGEGIPGLYQCETPSVDGVCNE